MIKYILGILIILTSSYIVFSQENSAKTGSVSGKIISGMTKNPISGVTVRIENTKLGAISKPDGTFSIKNIPVGIYSVKFSAIGYITFVESDVSVNTATTPFIEVELIEKIIELKGAEVRASYFNKMVETSTSTQFLSSDDIRRAPGVQEDVIRATALLPGVGVTQAGRNDLVVRGGAPFENLFVVDNIEVPNINHFGSQGSSGGPLSIINIDFVKNVSFSSGGFASRFGDKVSSITNINLRNGNEEKFGGKAYLSATGFGANVEGPLFGKGSYFFGVRRSYLDFLFKAAGFSFIPQYWDFQGKANYKLDEKNSLSFIAIGALGTVSLNNDDADNRYDNSRVAIPKQDQYFSGITWRHLFKMGYFTITLGETFTKYNITQNDSNTNKIFWNYSKESETTLKTDFDLQLNSTMQLTFGNQVKWATNLDYDIFIPGYLRTDQNGQAQPLKVDTNFRVYKNATYASLTTSIEKFRFTLGGRMEYYNFTDPGVFFSPRLSIIYQLNEISGFNLGAGRYYQSPSYVWLVGDAVNKNLKPFKVDQIVLGYDHTPMEDLKVQIEVFYKWYNDYPARVFRPQAVLAPSGFDDLTSDIPYGLEPLTSGASGWARGFEFFVQKKLSEIPLYGLFSLSLGESKFTSLEGKERYGAFDTRVILNISVGYRFNDYWELSGKFRYATGLPTTPYDANGNKIYSQYNEGDRLPDFHALDIRLDKRWDLNGLFLITYLDFQNIYGRKNVNGIKWNQRTLRAEKQESIGLLPSIGVSIEF